MDTVSIKPAAGMSNLPRAADGKFPALLLNAFFANGAFIKRGGYARILAIPGLNALWGGPTFLLAAGGGKVYDVTAGTAVQILSGVSTMVPVSGCEVGGVAYFGNSSFTAMYRGAAGSNLAESWGAALPAIPTCVGAATGGLLPAGTYHVSLCNVDALGRLGGCSPLQTITLTGDTSKITISSYVSGQVAFCTEPNGTVLFRVALATGGIITSINTSEPLPTLLCHAPPPLTGITYAHGRVWGWSGGTLYYSEPFRPDLFRSAFNKFTLTGTGNTIARHVGGLFAGTSVETFSLLGTDPAKMVVTSVGARSIPGSLSYCDSVKDLGDVLQVEEKVHDAVPIWMTAEGLVLGNAAGRLYNLTANKLTLPTPSRAASIFMRQDGIPLAVFTWQQAEADDDLGAAFSTGSLMQPAPPASTPSAQVYNTWVLSGAGFAPAVFSGFAFSAYTMFQGTPYALGADGLYTLGAADDAGAEIEAGAMWDGRRFGTANEKRLRKIKLGGALGRLPMIRVSDGVEFQEGQVDANGEAVVSRVLHGREWTITAAGFDELLSLDAEVLERPR